MSNYNREKYFATSVILDKFDNEIMRANMINTSQVVRYMIKGYIKERGLRK